MDTGTVVVDVMNRDNGSVGYTIPDRNLHRTFAPKETKKISLDELQQLSYVPGGEYILKNCLIVNDKTALEMLNIEVEPEYFYTEATIENLLMNGTLDELEDTLNFAPQGVIDLVKQIAVTKEIPDTRKRQMISEKTGFNVDNAINVNRIMNAEDTKPAEEEPKVRKASPVTSPSETPQRKASTSKYKVVGEE